MGNRGGALHNEAREIVRQFKSRQWITCVLEFKGRRRTVMSPRLYTELFFLDEAVALAAGHRPCAECRRGRYNEFREAWKSAGMGLLSAPAIDLELHRARVDQRGRKVTWEAPLGALPDGCFVEKGNSSYLVHGGDLLQWAQEGYVSRHSRGNDEIVKVLTPEPIVQCIRHGFIPGIHDSARAL
jgi:hypothetical protein